VTWQSVQDFPGLSIRLGQNTDGRTVVTGLTLESDVITSEMLRQIPLARIEQAANSGADINLPPLRRKDGMDSDEFSRLVAEHYKVWARYVPSPVARMADHVGIKPATLHSWVREARLRGHLPPARRGKS
jgi:hypothetical protein